jgi:hypothetical protein
VVFSISASSTSTNLAVNAGGSLSLCNTSATDNNFSNIGGYNSNGLVVSQIDFINVTHAGRTGDIAFLTHNGTSMSERMRIDKNGYIGINNSIPNRMLHVHDSRTTFGSAAFENTNVSATSGTSIFSNYYGPNNSGFLFLQFNADQGGTPEAVFTVNGVGDVKNKNNSYGQSLLMSVSSKTLLMLVLNGMTSKQFA